MNKEFEISYEVELKSGEKVKISEIGTNIILTDSEFSFLRLKDGFMLTYYLRENMMKNEAINIKNINIKEIN